MFPNRPEIRFERRVHEQMMPSALRLGLLMEPRQVVIEHHGYADPETLKSKSRRNIDLMLAEYDPGLPDPVTAVEVGDSYQLIEAWSEAETWYRAVLAMPDVAAAFPAIAGQALVGLAAIANRRNEHAEAAGYLEQALRIGPGRLDAMYLLAVSHDCLGAADKAIGCLRRIHAARDAPGQVGVDFRAVRIKASLRLLRILTEQRRGAEAEAEAEAALSRHPDRPEVALMAAKTFLAAGNLEFIRLFEKSIALSGPDNLDAYPGLCCIYGRAGREETMRQTLDAIQPRFIAMPRYWSLRRHFLNDGSPICGGFTEQQLAEEFEAAKRDFFGMVV